ncbi:DUF1189 domain-containing protein [Granulicatella sp. zg-84]|nr:DUF1189 domain-containing protein [Granulicatella sp. zg-84]
MKYSKEVKKRRRSDVLKVLLLSFQNPKLLLQVTLLPRKMIVQLTLFLAVLISLPSMARNIYTTTQLRNDLTKISSQLPDFYLKNHQAIDETSKKSQAIQTDNVYFLYDSQNSISKSTIETIISKNTMVLILNDKTLSIYTVGMNVSNMTISNDFSKDRLTQLINGFNNSLYLLYLLVPFLMILTSLLTVLVNNIVFSLTSNMFFLTTRRKIRRDYLWRVCLFLSALPYMIMTALELFGIYISIGIALATAYIIFQQHRILKDIL